MIKFLFKPFLTFLVGLDVGFDVGFVEGLSDGFSVGRLV